MIVPDEPVALAEGTAVTIQPVSSFDFGENLSITELARHQQVPAAVALHEIAGDWPAEEPLDEFLTALRERRQ